MSEEYDGFATETSSQLLNDTAANSTLTDSTTTDINLQEIDLGTESLVVIFIFFVLLLGSLVRVYSKKYRVWEKKNFGF